MEYRIIKIMTISKAPILNPSVVLNISFLRDITFSEVGLFSIMANSQIMKRQIKNTYPILSKNGTLGSRNLKSVEKTNVPSAAAKAPLEVAFL